MFTNNAFPLFPYDEKYLNGWFTQNCSRSNDAKGKTNQKVKIFNASNKDEAIRGIIEVESLKKDEDENTELYFHGTDHSSAQNILENGIELSKDGEKCDLSHRNGFYMANDYEYSLTQYCNITEAALLIFCLRQNNMNDFRELYLCGNRNRRDFATVTQYFNAGMKDRKGSMSRELLSDLERCDYIKSPISSDGRSADDQKEDILQVCVKKHKMAETKSNRQDFVSVTPYFRAERIDCKGSMSRELFLELEKCDYIKSPITSDGRSAGEQREDILQVCIKKPNMAETISGSLLLVGAVFIKPDSEENDSVLGFDSFVY
ncbi:uncharacterized protein LOC124440645 isoform X1 [Xenia sp. Carnegie-2017]|uniref:uncharacterized protein LOC124440645 isoform X1 n=1 Tax=Xenia sp. Carnegie-2017 TaxID=2897299 RepID=UPI001F04D6A5|nr:uncharacterized protein LOC124440645 isoform X1 [Xenia sp. Carnegie-2017]XP_046847019.1 uncharacterized protein LOC124440645 isoform X1 [Xenia sp. Carnegie-2017]XP_046847024.1 uncharacterized protein LOC124440645 isoform X1 [Xenia sp. Carnegie-2017]